jgi:hypothetical protein
MKVLFIHRSVGQHLLEHGNLRKLLNEKNIELDDYNNNSGIITHDDSSVTNKKIIMPGDNTNPDNLEAFFKSWPETLTSYDAVMIKSCYPNSHIKTKQELELIKSNYTSIFESFRSRQKLLIILTTPPLRPLLTNRLEASFANQLADWLMTQTNNLVHVFNFHKELSEPEGKHAGMLKRGYRRLAPWDNHPNNKAHKKIAPFIADAIKNALNLL